MTSKVRLTGRRTASGLLLALPVILTVVAIAAFIRFPIHFSDSARYLGVAARLGQNNYSPVTFSLLHYPLFLLVGPWAFTSVNCLLLIYVSIEFSRRFFSRIRPLPIIAAMLLSGVVTMASAVMMDLHTTLAVLALIVLSRSWSLLCWCVVLIGLLSHSSALIILPALALCAGVLLRSIRPLVALGTALVAWLVMTLIGTTIVFGHPQLSPRNSVLFLTARMMADTPESVVAFAAAYPESAIARELNGLFEEDPDISAASFQPIPKALLWNRGSVFQRAGHDTIRDEAFDYIRFSWTRYPWQNAKAVVLNPFRCFKHMSSETIDAGFVRGEGAVTRIAQGLYPELAPAMRRGVQYQGTISSTYSSRAVLVSYWLSMLWSVVLVVYWILARKQEHRELCMVLPAAVLVFCLLNAFVVGNFNYVGAGRSTVRMMYAPILLACLGSSVMAPRAWAMWRQRIKARRPPA